MRSRTLNYRFHNPTPAAAADRLLELLVESNWNKVQLAVQAAADRPAETGTDGRPAG